MKIFLSKYVFMLILSSLYINKNLPLVIEKNWTKFYLGNFENHVLCEQWDNYIRTHDLQNVYLNLVVYDMIDVKKEVETLNTTFEIIESERNMNMSTEQYFDFVDFTKIQEDKESFQIDFNVDYEVDQNFRYAIYLKLLQNSNTQQLQHSLIFYIVAYQEYFDISLREFILKKNQWVLNVYRGFDNQNLDYRVKKKRASCKVPLDFDESKITSIRDTMKKQLPQDLTYKKDYFISDIIKDIPSYFPSKFYALNAFSYTGSNMSNYYKCQIFYDKQKNLTEAQTEDDIEFQQSHQEDYTLEIVSKVVSASIEYQLERDYFRQSLNKDERPCYNFKVEYYEESQKNRSFMDSYPIGCLDHDIEIQIKDIYYENYQSMGTTWFQFLGKKSQSKLKSLIIHKGSEGFKIKNKNLFMPHFSVNGSFFPIMIHKDNTFLFNLYYSSQNLFQIIQKDEQTYLQETVPLNQLSLREYAMNDSKRVICQRSFYEDGQVLTEKDFKLEDREKVNILIIDEIVEKIDEKKQLPVFRYVMTFSKSMKNQHFYGPLGYSNDVPYVCWQKIDDDSVDYIIIPQAIGIPFKHPLAFLEFVGNDLKFQLYSNYTSLDLSCSIPKSELESPEDFNIFEKNISVNYISVEQNYLSWAFQYIQNKDGNQNDLKESMIFTLKEANITLEPGISECQLLSKDDEIIVNIYLEGIQSDQPDQDERKLTNNLQKQNIQQIENKKDIKMQNEPQEKNINNKII